MIGRPFSFNPILCMLLMLSFRNANSKFSLCCKGVILNVFYSPAQFSVHILLHSVCLGEESLMIFVDKRRLSRTVETREANSTAVTLEALHQLAASYFIDRESTLRKLHHIQIASTAIKVNLQTAPHPDCIHGPSPPHTFIPRAL